MSEWKRYKLGELLSIKHGWAFKSENYVKDGKTALVTLRNISEDSRFVFDVNKTTYYGGEYPEEYNLNEGDLIIPLTEQVVGLLGNSAFVPNFGDIKFVLNQRVGKVQEKYEKIDKIFLKYLLSTTTVRTQMEYRASGTKQRNISPKDIYDIEVYIPELVIQKYIGRILYNLDKKIQINNQINQELEAMAKTLYDYWFVQFDFPDQNGKPYKSSGGKMVYNPDLKREIPEGWGVDSLWNIANFYNGLAMQKYRPDTNEDDYIPVIKIREMMNGFSKDTEKARLDIPIEAVVERGDILFSWSATLEVIIWGKERGALNQHIFKVTSDTYPKSFIYFELKSYLKVFKAIAELRKTTMGHITQDHLKQAKIVVPPIELISKLDAKLQPIMLKQQILENQNQELTQLRDWLLPMLMNGQVKVENFTD
jgi:restriction modification system DNA specificity subunit